MVTEQELREALAEAVDDPAAQTFTLGLSDRALAEAGFGIGTAARSRRGSWLPPRVRMRWAPAVAVGSAFVAAAVVGVAALGTGAGDGGSGGRSSSAMGTPDAPTDPVGQSAITEYAAECFNGHGPKLDLAYVWDPATQRYHGVAGDTVPVFSPSPDGKRALVEQGVPPGTQTWAVAGWSDAVAGRLTPHPLAGSGGVHWSPDGKEVVADVAWSVDKATGGNVLGSRTADFYDPATGHLLAAVPIPQQVLTKAASGQWSVQEFQGDHDSVLFPLLSAAGDRLDYLNAQGTTVRTLTLHGGFPGNPSSQPGASNLAAALSPDGRYLAESDFSTLAVFDLQAGGKRIATKDITRSVFHGWIGDHQMVTAFEKGTVPQPAPTSKGDVMPTTGHNPVYSVLTPELKVVQQAEFVLPSDPHGACATWPLSWAPTGQFPGAFVP